MLEQNSIQRRFCLRIPRLGAYPLFRVLALSNRVGNRSSRPRNSERNTRTLSAGVRGIGTPVGGAVVAELSGSVGSPANLA